MYKKKCPNCNNYSYFASKKGFWRCAVCNADISDVEAEETGKNSLKETGK